MDKQLALMKRYQKDDNTIAYVHNGEIVLIKRENGTLLEIIVDPETESTVSSRTLSAAEMTLKQFAVMKKELTDTTTADFNSEQRNTYRNVSYDAIGDNIETSRPSVEEEYISAHTVASKDDTFSCMYFQLRQAKLTKKQLWRFIKCHYYKCSLKQIANDEGVCINAVWESIQLADEKIKNYFRRNY